MNGCGIGTGGVEKAETTKRRIGYNGRVMKTLVRPFLFAVARLGLFFTVVAWVVRCNFVAYAMAPRLGALIAPEGMALAIPSAPEMWDAKYAPTSHSERIYWHRWLFELPSDRSRSYRQSSGFSIGGLTGQQNSDGLFLSVHHGIVFTGFAMINVLLSFIYRRKSDGAEASA